LQGCLAMSSVGAHLCAMLLALGSEKTVGSPSSMLHKSRAFVRLRRPSYFLFAWPKRKITKEKGHPAWRLPGFLPGKSVSRGRAFRQHIHVLAKRSRHPCRLPLRGLSTPTHRRTGAPGRAAGHPGPHSVRHRCAAAEAKEREIQLRTRLCTVTNVSVGQLRPFTSGGFASYICSSRVIVVGRSATVGL